MKTFGDVETLNIYILFRHIPAWFPGAGFKRKALKMLDNRIKFASRTFQSVVDKVVSCSLA
jgi:hypothetical protein